MTGIYRVAQELTCSGVQGYVSIPLLCSFKRMSNTLKLNHGTSAAEIPAELISKVCASLASTASTITSTSFMGNLDCLPCDLQLRLCL